MTLRKLKKESLALLQADDLNTALEAFCRFPARQIVNPLFGLLYHREALIRWRAVTAMGAVVSKLADDEPESARVVMRRFLWNLNDESGGIGWGSPECLGEITARHASMADEYACMLLSYADPKGNYLEHPILQYGVIWALGRLGRVRPGFIRPSARLLVPWLQSADPNLRGLAAWAARPLKSDQLKNHLANLRKDTSVITIYREGELRDVTVGALSQSCNETQRAM